MLSIVIPTLNEARNLPPVIEHTVRMAGRSIIEFIVSDCESRDGTAAIAARFPGVKVVRGGRCRADALNRGSAVATGNTLLFLHADTYLPPKFAEIVEASLANEAIVGGAFDFDFGAHESANFLDRRLLTLVVLCNRIRFRWTGNFYGDQAIFCRRSVFTQMGGFPSVVIMEDIRFSQKMKRQGKTAILQPRAITSPRRFLKCGVVRQFMHDLALLGCESFGTGSKRLGDLYNVWNQQSSQELHPAAPPDFAKE